MTTKLSTRQPSKFYKVALGLLRIPPALKTQRRFQKASADRIAAHLDLDKLGVPILNHRDGVFWVIDGQHRVTALRTFGFGKDDLFECQVFENLTDAQAADIFLGGAQRLAVHPFDKFHVACTAGWQRELDIQRVVEANGLKVSQGQGEGCIGAVAALAKVYDRSSDVLLGRVLRTIKNAWAGDAKAFDGAVIEGLGFVFQRYGKIVNEPGLIERLGAIPNGARGVILRAQSQRDRTGNQKVQCIAAAIVEIYNKGLAGRDRLPSWWKEAE